MLACYTLAARKPARPRLSPGLFPHSPKCVGERGHKTPLPPRPPSAYNLIPPSPSSPPEHHTQSRDSRQRQAEPASYKQMWLGKQENASTQCRKKDQRDIYTPAAHSPKHRSAT